MGKTHNKSRMPETLNLVMCANKRTDAKTNKKCYLSSVTCHQQQHHTPSMTVQNANKSKRN